MVARVFTQPETRFLLIPSRGTYSTIKAIYINDLTGSSFALLQRAVWQAACDITVA
jgi:hypothetical protein